MKANFNFSFEWDLHDVPCFHMGTLFQVKMNNATNATLTFWTFEELRESEIFRKLVSTEGT